MQPLWRTVWKFLKNLKIELLYDPVIPQLGINPETMKTLIWKDTCIPMFIALFIIPKMWEQPNSPSTEEWVTMWHIYTMEYSVQFSRSVVSNSLWPHESQHTRPPCPSPTPKVYSKSSTSSRWCYSSISSSLIPFSACLQSFSASGSFQISQFFKSGGQSIGVSASALVLPMNTQDWSPLGCTGWISLQSKGLSGVFSNTAIQKHQFFGLSNGILLSKKRIK